MMTQTDPQLPIPAGATADHWSSVCTVTGRLVRHLSWWENTVAGIAISVGGTQYSDGELSGPQVTIYGEDEDLTAAQARELAATLLAAAAHLESLK